MRVELDKSMSFPYRVGNRGFQSLEEATNYLHSKEPELRTITEQIRDADKAELKELRGRGIKCPWCERGKLENTPKAYNDPATVVYCPECSTVYDLKQRLNLSP